MVRYIYHGPVQSISLAVGHTKDDAGHDVTQFEDIDLRPGQQTPDLPADNPIIASLIDAGRLVAVAAGGSTKPKPTSKGDT